MTAGRKHPLIIYSRTMSRLWFLAMFFGLEMLALWKFKSAFSDTYRPELDLLLLFAGLYGCGLGLFALLGRRMSYIRAFDRYFLVATPLFRFKTSYRRVRGVRATDFHRLFELNHLSWAEERYTQTMIGRSAVVVNLVDYPVSPRLAGLFFHRYLFSPKGTELVLLVPDWMALSVELDSRYNDYRQRRRAQKQASGFQRGNFS